LPLGACSSAGSGRRCGAGGRRQHLSRRLPRPWQLGLEHGQEIRPRRG